MSKIAASLSQSAGQRRLVTGGLEVESLHM
jgi:hypothetical protein